MQRYPVSLLAYCAFLMTSGCAATQSAGGTLLLKSGFEEGVRITDDLGTISGSDVPGYTWDQVPQWESSRFAYIISRGSKAIDFVDSVIERQRGPEGRDITGLGRFISGLAYFIDGLCGRMGACGG